MASFQKTGNESTSTRGIQALGNSRSSSATSDNGSASESTRRIRSPVQSRPANNSQWIQRLRSVGCQVRRSRGRLLSLSCDLSQREERISSTCAIRAWDVRGEKVQENNFPELRTPDVTDGRKVRVISADERNIPFGVSRTYLSSSSSSRHVGEFSENVFVSSGTVRISENTSEFRAGEAAEPGDRSLEPSQLVGPMPSQLFVQSNSADNCSTHSLRRECLLDSPSSSHTPPKVRDICKMEKLDCPVGAQKSIFRDDVLSYFEHMQRCSEEKGLHQEVQGAFPSTGIENTPWSTELSSFHDTCSTSSSVVIKNLHCNNIGVSQPLVLENNSDANETAIYGKYAHKENILCVNKYNSQTSSGAKGIDKNGQVCKQLEIVDGDSGLSAGTPDLPKTVNLWTSRFKEKSIPNKETQGGGNIDGPLEGSSEDVIARSMTKEKGIHFFNANSRKKREQTLSSLLWLQHWRCSNKIVTQRLMKTCLDLNQKCQSDSVIKRSIDTKTSDASGSLTIAQDTVKDNSVERG